MQIPRPGATALTPHCLRNATRKRKSGQTNPALRLAGPPRASRSGPDSGIPRAANFERPGGRNAKRRKILGLMAVTKPKPPMEKGISSEEKLSEDPE